MWIQPGLRNTSEIINFLIVSPRMKQIQRYLSALKSSVIHENNFFQTSIQVVMCPSLVHEIIAFNASSAFPRQTTKDRRMESCWAWIERTFTINAHTIQLKTSPSLGRDFMPNLTYSDAHFQISHSISPTRLCLLHVYLSCVSDAHLIFMRNVSDRIYHSTNRLRPHCIHYSWAAVLKWTVNTHTISELIRRSHNKTSVIDIVYSNCSCCSEWERTEISMQTTVYVHTCVFFYMSVSLDLKLRFDLHIKLPFIWISQF